jgi:cysteinyl-tRNA synthetase, unknown class
VKWLLVVFCALSTAHAKPWLYQLQNPDPSVISRAGFGVAVIDYSRDGTNASRLRPAQLRKLARKHITTLAYLSIGEAENYRFYWNAGWVARENANQFTTLAPAWLGHTNPDWLGNYKVRYWDSAWRDGFVRPYLDRILAQGFKGIYLDIVDAFEYWAASENYGAQGETFRVGDPRGNEAEAARRMIDLVVWIKNYARSHGRSGFLVYPQNAENILQHDRDGYYMKAISGLGVEDLFYDETRRQRSSETNFRLNFLRKVKAAGKRVLCVDYVDTGIRTDPTNKARIEDFVQRCEAEGFDFYAARKDRELDRINTIPGLQP